MFSGVQGGGTPGGRCCQAASPPPPCIVPPTYQLCRLWTKYTTLSAISTTCNTTCAVCFTWSLSHMANTSLIFLLFALVSSMLGSAFPMNRIQMSIARCCACVAFPVAPVCRWAEEPALPTWEPKASLKPMQHSCVFHSPERWHASANSVAASPPTQERFPAKSSGCQPDLYLPPNTLSAPFKFGIWESAWVLLIEAEANQWWNRKSGKLGIFNAGLLLMGGCLPIPTSHSNLCNTLLRLCVFCWFSRKSMRGYAGLPCHGNAPNLGWPSEAGKIIFTRWPLSRKIILWHKNVQLWLKAGCALLLNSSTSECRD